MTQETIIFVSLILIADRINSFLRSYIKAEGNFLIIGRAEFVLTFSPLVSIPAVILFRLYGALLAIFLAHVFAAGYFWISLKKPKFHFSFNLRKTLLLLKSGFMIFLNKIVGNIFWSVDLIFIGAMLTTRDVGSTTSPWELSSPWRPFRKASTWPFTGRS